MVFGVHLMKKKYYEIHPTRPVLARGLTSITITLIFFIHPPTVFLFMRCVADLYVLTALLCFVVSFDRVRVRNPPILFLSTNRNFFLVSNNTCFIRIHLHRQSQSNADHGKIKKTQKECAEIAAHVHHPRNHRTHLNGTKCPVV